MTESPCTSCARMTLQFVTDQTGGKCVECARKESAPAPWRGFLALGHPPKEEPQYLSLEVCADLHRLLESCEENCVIGCCGLDAIEATQDKISQWIRQAGFVAHERVKADLEQLASSTANETRTVIFYEKDWPPSLFRLWIQEFAERLRCAAEECK